MKKLLHIGCGRLNISNTTSGFSNGEYIETRVDIDPSVSPDIVGSMTDLSKIETETFDAIYSSHNLEHLYPHEVMVALIEFLRVLKQDGILVLTVPDLKSTCALVAEDKLLETAYLSEGGPISPIDILYGWRHEMQAGNLYMAHKCGFTKKVLTGILGSAGFKITASIDRPQYFDLWAIASKSVRGNDEMRILAIQHFPSSKLN